MQASIEQISQIVVFVGLELSDKLSLQPHTQVQRYLKGEIILHEGDVLPDLLFALVSGSIQITKTAGTGKETILRTLSAGEIFIARSIGITYEECVRIIKSLKSVITYSRGGKITILDAKKLEEVASGNMD